MAYCGSYPYAYGSPYGSPCAPTLGCGIYGGCYPYGSAYLPYGPYGVPYGGCGGYRRC